MWILTFPFLSAMATCLLGRSSGVENNVCPRYRDYTTMRNNSNCWYNFAAQDRVPDIIKKTGYPFMEYKVRTKDGYVLRVFRIPSLNSQKAPIFLMHGVHSSSAVFLGLGRDSIAFLLADAGYDVWLGNYRGTEYSEGHTSLNATQKEYWNYGADEIGLIDVPSMLSLVRFHTNRRGKIIYIGHSLGVTSAIMYASEYPEHAKKTVKLFIWISPAYKLNHMRSPYRMFLPFMKTILSVTDNFNAVQTFSQRFANRFNRPACLTSPAVMMLCLSLLNLFVGPFTQIAPETVPVLFNNFPAGTSLKTLTYISEAVRGRFGKYDYGDGRNTAVYGNSTAPEYDISRIQISVFVFYAAHDWATSKPDALNLYQALPKSARYGIYEISNLNFNHFDFLFGRNARQLVYDKLLSIITIFEEKEKTENKTDSYLQ